MTRKNDVPERDFHVIFAERHFTHDADPTGFEPVQRDVKPRVSTQENEPAWVTRVRTTQPNYKAHQTHDAEELL